MKLERWALIAEIVGGVAVVVTLIFLIVGIRANTQVTRTSMYADSMWEINETERNVLSDPELSRIWQAFVEAETSELSEIDLRRLRHNLQVISRTYDTVLSMQADGLLGENEWARFESSICDTYRTAENAGAEYVDIYLNISSPGFRAHIESSC